jgi:hypothetical protein
MVIQLHVAWFAARIRWSGGDVPREHSEASGSHHISMEDCEIFDLFIVSNFASHTPILMYRVRWSILVVPSIQPIDRRPLAVGGEPPEHIRCMIHDDEVDRLIIDAGEFLISSFGLRALENEYPINIDAFLGQGGILARI